MPYIIKSRRIPCYATTDDDCKTPGELNYAITCLIKGYYETLGESYQTYNDIIGVLECTKLELYRRLISFYEDQKCKINGDVYNEREPI